MKKLTTLLIATFIVISAVAQSTLDRIAEEKTLRIGLTGNQPPFATEAIDGSLIGFEIDLANLIADAMKVELKLVQMPFKDLLTALENAEVDVIMSGMAMTTARNMQYAFVGPYFVTGKSVLSKSASYSNDNINELNAKNVKIASLKGSTSEAYVKSQFPEAKHVHITDYEEAVRMLRNDEIHALVADYTECTFLSFKNSTDRFYVTDDLLTTERIGLAVSPSDPLFVNLLTNFLDEIKDSGQLNELENEWVRSMDWMDRVE